MGRYISNNKENRRTQQHVIPRRKGVRQKKEKVVERQSGDAQQKDGKELPKTIAFECGVNGDTHQNNVEKEQTASRSKSIFSFFEHVFLTVLYSIPLLIFIYLALNRVHAVDVMNNGSVATGVVVEHNYIRSSKIKVNGKQKDLFGAKGWDLPFSSEEGDSVRVLTTENSSWVVLESSITKWNKFGLYFETFAFVMIVVIIFVLMLFIIKELFF